MMRARILETPDKGRAHSCEQTVKTVRQLSSSERNYYSRRAVQEHEAAAGASCCEARVAHSELAAAYGRLCRSNGALADPHLTATVGTVLTIERRTP